MENYSINIEEILKNSKEYYLVDIRESHVFEYSTIPSSVHIDENELLSVDICQDGRKTLIFCMDGQKSKEKTQILREKGVLAYYLEGGFGEYLIAKSPQENEDDTPFYKSVEKSIQKKFHKRIFSKFTKAIKEYDLVSEGDKIAVCISGGKDSMLMAKLFEELQRHRKVNFELVFLVMDPGYNDINRKLIEKNAKLLNIPVTIFDTGIFDAVVGIEKSPCYICARMRRGHLYSKARELGCNKIALGHHYDDVIETILMGMMYGGQVQTMMPKLPSTNFEGMELIRPLYLVKEEDVIHFRDYNKLDFLQCACKFTETATKLTAEGGMTSKRTEMKHLIRELKKINPFVESNIFRSVENVNLSTIIAYKQNGVKHHFLDNYGNDTIDDTEI